MKGIGVISEGVTDQIVLRHILASFLENKNLLVKSLQPKTKEDGGNWDKVFKYCATDEFKNAFSTNDFIVIHVDTDFFRTDGVPEYLRVQQMHEKEPEETLQIVKDLLIEQIGKAFFDTHQHQIIFAIAVDEIECWFLSVYQPDKKKAAKTINCIDNLNKALSKAGMFTIGQKDDRYYNELCKPFRKKKDLLEYSQPNASFNAFIEELNVKLTPSTIS